MKILFDGRVLEGGSSGVRDIAAGIVAGMRALQLRGEVDFTVATVGETPETDLRLPARFFMHVSLPSAALRGGFDRILVPRQTVPVLSAIRSVPVFHDIGFIERPDLYRETRAITATTKLSSRSRTALAVSKYTADRMDARGLKKNVISMEIGAVHRIDWVPDRVSPYVLCIAAQEPHKNLPTLIEAWGALGEAGATLVLCGRSGTDSRAVQQAVSELPDPSAVRIASGLNDGEYARLLSGASGYVQPSLYEGLCIPAMDMAAAGVPMVVANASNLGARFAGAPAGQCIDATDTQALTRALAMLLHDEGFRARSSAYNSSSVLMTDWVEVARRALGAM